MTQKIIFILSNIVPTTSLRFAIFWEISKIFEKIENIEKTRFLAKNQRSVVLIKTHYFNPEKPDGRIFVRHGLYGLNIKNIK